MPWPAWVYEQSLFSRFQRNRQSFGSLPAKWSQGNNALELPQQQLDTLHGQGAIGAIDELFDAQHTEPAVRDMIKRPTIPASAQPAPIKRNATDIQAVQPRQMSQQQQQLVEPSRLQPKPSHR
ncbi:hypothetical protein LPJ56_006724, partial [Coemansia sp. RSA 2599]